MEFFRIESILVKSYSLHIDKYLTNKNTTPETADGVILETVENQGLEQANLDRKKNKIFSPKRLTEKVIVLKW